MEGQQRNNSFVWGSKSITNACSAPINRRRCKTDIFLSERSLEKTNKDSFFTKFSDFGTKAEADESAHRINKLHEVIKGEDEVTGGYYDALDHEQLLWVHACLQISSIYFYEKTVGKLTIEEKNKYHIENMFAAELVLVDKNLMPKTHNELKEWVIEKSQQKDYLVKTDVALDVYDIIGGGPVPKHIKPIWPFIAFTAFNTLPKEFKDIYGIKSSKLKSVLVNFNLFLLKFTRPFLPSFFELIAPARWAKQRITKSPQLKFSDKANY